MASSTHRLAVLYLVVLATVSIVWRFPASRDRVVLFVLAALFIAVVGRPNALSRLARDFAPGRCLPVRVRPAPWPCGWTRRPRVLHAAAAGRRVAVRHGPDGHVATRPLDGWPSPRLGLRRFPRVSHLLHPPVHHCGRAVAIPLRDVPPLCEPLDRPVVRGTGHVRRVPRRTTVDGCPEWGSSLTSCASRRS